MTLLNEAALLRLHSALTTTDDRFDQLLRLAGLNPLRDLQYADLRNVNFEGSHLIGWDLTGADLRGASFRGAHVRNCTFTDAVGVDMSGAIRVHSTEALFALPDFHYRDGVLHAEDIDIRKIADKVGTPFYCYSTASLVRHFEEYRRAFNRNNTQNTLICYALKANSNQSIIATLARRGAGASVVSEGELRRALTAGIPAEKIVFNGPGKSERDLALAVDEGVLSINVESKSELEALSDIAAARGRKASISVRIDTTSAVTGFFSSKNESKFALLPLLARELCSYAGTLAGVRLVGVSVHIGSSVTQLERFADAFAQMAEIVSLLRADGHQIAQVNLGGGLPIAVNDISTYARPTPDDLVAATERVMQDLGCRLIVEPGKYIVGNSGVLITTVLYVKPGEAKTFVIVDAAMNDLLRPTLYEAYHEICSVALPSDSARNIIADIVGPVCESGDFLALSRELIEPKTDDLLAVMSAGGYGAVQATNYNTRATVAEVLVNGSEFAIVRPRIEVEAIIARDRLPPWVNGSKIVAEASG